MNYEFELPWPPSVNAWIKPFRNRLILTKRGREYRKAVIDNLTALKLDNEMIAGDLVIRMTLNPPTLRKYDVDNFNKALFDGLTNAGFWVDDEQVQKLTVTKGEKIKGGNVIVNVSVID